MFGLDLLLVLGILAGILQLLGYYYYLSIEEIDPNPASWLMFAYGTALLTFLEWENNATLPELILPTACSILSIVVAIQCWLKSNNKHSLKLYAGELLENFWDRTSIILDILITVGYLTAWFLAAYTLLHEQHILIAMIVFLWLSNLSTITSFIPILRSTASDSTQEHYLPWFIWTISYTVLGVTTYLTHGTVWHILMIYPASNMVFHFWVGYLALPKKSKHDRL